MVPLFLFSLGAIYIPYISTPTAHHAENSVLYNINGFAHKLYGVRSDINGIIIAGNNKMVKIIRYLCGILFFIVNHHCIKLQDMTPHFYTHTEPDYTVNGMIFSDFCAAGVVIYGMYVASKLNKKRGTTK